MSQNFRVENVFESEMTVDAATRLPRVFDTAMLDHMIKFHHEDEDDLRADGNIPRRIRYRVIIEVMDP